MKFTNEQLAKIKATKSIEELLALAKENGIELTEEEAAKYFAELHKEGELSDEELNNVAGGCGGSSNPDPKFKVGQQLWLGYFTTQNYLHIEVHAPEFYEEGRGWRYLVRPLDIGQDFLMNEYLETREFVHTSNPGPKWIG